VGSLSAYGGLLEGIGSRSQIFEEDRRDLKIHADVYLKMIANVSRYLQISSNAHRYLPIFGEM